MTSDRKELQMIASSRYLPKRSVSKPRGEDAHLFYASRQAIIVCDGVGGWAKQGIDSRLYALKLVWNTAVALQKQPKRDVNPKEALLEAHAKTIVKGSSTAGVITLTGNKLRFANVGDSGFLVFRDRKRLVYQSPQRQHSFNCPYQLAVSEWDDDDVSSVVNEGEVEVEAGDVVVAGTDGMLDNLFAFEIENILQETEGGSLFPEKLARKIASTARANSKNKKYESPFAREAKLARKEHLGGKYDDITVVVAEIGFRVAEHKTEGAEMESAVMENKTALVAEMESAVVECKTEVGAEVESAAVECKALGAEMESLVM